MFVETLLAIALPADFSSFFFVEDFFKFLVSPNPSIYIQCLEEWIKWSAFNNYFKKTINYYSMLELSFFLVKPNARILYVG